MTAPDVPPPVSPVPAVTDSMSAEIVAHDAVLPSVVKYFPEFPVCDGRLIGAAAHSTPLVAEELAVKIYPFVPTASLATVLSAEATRISPFASKVDKGTYDDRFDVKATVPLESGSVMVRSAVGSVTVKVVS